MPKIVKSQPALNSTQSTTKLVKSNAKRQDGGWPVTPSGCFKNTETGDLVGLTFTGGTDAIDFWSTSAALADAVTGNKCDQPMTHLQMPMVCPPMPKILSCQDDIAIFMPANQSLDNASTQAFFDCVNLAAAEVITSPDSNPLNKTCANATFGGLAQDIQQPMPIGVGIDNAPAPVAGVSTGLSHAAKAGIGAGVVATVLLAVTAGLLLFRARSRRQIRRDVATNPRLHNLVLVQRHAETLANRNAVELTDLR